MVLAEYLDFIIAAGSVLFFVALLPSVWKKAGRAIPLTSSSLTGGVLWAYAITFLDAGLLFSSAATTLTATMWTILAIQRVMSRRKKE